MPLETFNYLDSLVPANPPISDGVVQGDDHLRGIKLALKNTFPNISGAVTGTQAALNAATGWTAAGVNLLDDTGVFFKTNTADGFKSPLAGDIDVILQGTVAATFQRTAGANFFKVNGGIQATGEIKGPGITPIGGTIIWWDDTLPSDGMWAWANGQVISNANTVAPVLLARWGNRFGGNGVTTMGLPDLREVTPVGKATMGGVAARNTTLWQYVTQSLLQTVGSFFGSAWHTLTTGETPAHRHGVILRDPGHTHGYKRMGGGLRNDGTSALTVLPTVIDDTTTLSGTGIVLTSGDGVDWATGPVGGSGAHNNVQPSTIVNWIIRIG